jgi:trehalose/maltose hydrolase-like predicted phosphorylase
MKFNTLKRFHNTDLERGSFMGVYEKDKKPAYGLDEWEIVEESFSPERNYHSETIFATGNGFIGMRGTFEEGLNGDGIGFEGTFLNGIYESGAIRYGEKAYGYPERSQTMISVANGKVIKLFLEDEAFDMQSGKLQSYRRSINMREGVLKRSLIWQSPKGKEIKLEVESFISLPRRNTAVVLYKVMPINFDGNIKIISAIDGNVTCSTSENDPRVGSGLKGDILKTITAKAEKGTAVLLQKTKNTQFYITAAFADRIKTNDSYEVSSFVEENYIELGYDIQAHIGEEIVYTKYIAYAAAKVSGDEILEQVYAGLEKAGQAGYEALKTEQEGFLTNYWNRSDIEIRGNLELQQAIRFNLFHLIQSVGRDGKTNIGAKGLTGEGYEGHYFWDTEMYVVPAFLYSNPDISRKLLEYRYNTLDKARERARQMSHPKGALFPWRTIDGEECSGFFPAGTAQYHINADIAFAIKKYFDATRDEDFILNFGAEILFETARLWADLGFFNGEKDGEFCINCVTGPDEYTAVVNNNCYTNLMVRENLHFAFETAQWLEKAYPEAFLEIRNRLGITEKETAIWKEAADKMYIPYSSRHNIHLQDDSFLDKKVWDFEGTPKENYPLLLHYHPLVIYRHQVCKQADLVLAMFLLGHHFDIEHKRRNYDYYEKITTHDSSLSSCIFCVAASEIGYKEKAYDFFERTVRMDLDDYQGNTNHGVHIANMAGSWMCIINGFAGMRTHEGRLGFSPFLPESWEQYSFKVQYKGSVVKVIVNKTITSYELIEGDCLNIYHDQKEIKLELGIPVVI